MDEGMNKICTSIKQSQKLLELGLDVNTADMMWYDWSLIDEGWKLNVGYYPEFEQDYGRKCYPAWSITALLDLMPPYLFEWERGIDLNIYPNLNGKGWHCSYIPNAVENMKNDKFKQISNGDNLIDAAFEMICWLKENGNL